MPRTTPVGWSFLCTVACRNRFVANIICVLSVGELDHPSRCKRTACPFQRSSINVNDPASYHRAFRWSVAEDCLVDLMREVPLPWSTTKDLCTGPASISRNNQFWNHPINTRSWQMFIAMASNQVVNPSPQVGHDPEPWRRRRRLLIDDIFHRNQGYLLSKIKKIRFCLWL